ncbi:cytochrome c oxidase subunit 3 [Acidocella aminolytica]|jgi:cytochrome c oxidase subunit 3|uniref:cytochrome-c oxidase n=1 Tax=Acidocella aminolytica 101 = DSM 11237 TaxID=1120923 RepID=A0A0D6PHH3_9PROT|nr:cytochrome c oxidase subunit 3 [Acidocella aminolytica]GAN81215.1 cytochrome c oxidase subunit III [Acidocella aminolytica 101 = DSM 11237]GBQ31893.1 cytochrome c oxidase subunit III [Acidocella aminolytica 101 = DSM 11237]SHE85186.1 cytochrome c oxidase subunit 3 [Acidocella aminolytica 101 = DSM 11237]
MSGTIHTATDQVKGTVPHPYHLVNPSLWPLLGAASAMTTFAGIILAAHFREFIVLTIGVVADLSVMFLWWRDVIKEALTPGLHKIITQVGLRYGMALFIASEVMFFVSFFWNYFNYFFFPDKMGTAFAPVWPPQGITTVDPFAVPLFNTMVLLLSGTTITWAHHSLLEGNQKNLVRGLGVTILLGLSFLCGQAWEYTHSPFPFYHGGIYPSSFFIATGFHGAHVIIGTLFLTVCFFRARAGQFTPQRHFGFEAAAWYWHFVDVVWLFLFVCIYYLGRSAITAG